jgi:hypothetical protein
LVPAQSKRRGGGAGVDQCGGEKFFGVACGDDRTGAVRGRHEKRSALNARRDKFAGTISQIKTRRTQRLPLAAENFLADELRRGILRRLQRIEQSHFFGAGAQRIRHRRRRPQHIEDGNGSSRKLRRFKQSRKRNNIDLNHWFCLMSQSNLPAVRSTAGFRPARGAPHRR